jgi:hypothetical protein
LAHSAIVSIIPTDQSDPGLIFQSDIKRRIRKNVYIEEEEEECIDLQKDNLDIPKRGYN